MICTLCNKEISDANYLKHYCRCEHLYKNKKEIITDYVDNLLTSREVCKKYKVSFNLIKTFLLYNGIDFRSHSEANKLSKKEHTKHTEECKRRLSELRKRYLYTHPNEHPWKKHDKFKSVPCEKFKNILNINNISFVDEYSPNGMLYSIDIAFPDKKIGIEINGNQHYNRDGTLKEYYLKRHNDICNRGWLLYECHYSLVYKQQFIESLITELKSTFYLGLIDYSFYIKEKIKPEIYCICGCGRKVYKLGNKCMVCNSLNNRKVLRPTYEQLKYDIDVMPMIYVGKKYGVSDNAVRKWISKYENEKLIA